MQKREDTPNLATVTQRLQLLHLSLSMMQRLGVAMQRKQKAVAGEQQPPLDKMAVVKQ